jgi:alcohol dehydrogenase
LKEVPIPNPNDNEVLVKIYATSVTASDVLMRGLKAPFIFKILIQLMMGFGKPRNPILGMVLSGLIEDTGKKVTKFKKGDKVFAYGAMTPLKLRFGSYAEYICLPEDWVIATKPQNITFEEAAAIPYGAFLAWYYFKNLEIQKGQKVLIYGASGSIGTMAIQLAKNKGAIVTAVCSNKNFEMVQSLGADKTIDYAIPESSTLLEKYDLVFDAVGKSKTSQLKTISKKALTSTGKYISVDDKTPSQTQKDLYRIKDMVEQEQLKVIIDRTYSLEEMVEAHKYVEQGHKKGNVVITVK